MKEKNFYFNQKPVLNMSELVEYTGFSKSFIYKLTSQRKIPHYRPNGKLLFFKKEEIDDWLLSNPVRTAEQIQDEHTKYLKQ